jgi:hypothetical protein
MSVCARVPRVQDGLAVWDLHELVCEAAGLPRACWDDFSLVGLRLPDTRDGLQSPAALQAVLEERPLQPEEMVCQLLARFAAGKP